jgi:4-alpha-glucanotransferase
MNRPGIAAGNWGWRLEGGQLTAALAARLRAATRRNGR